MRSKVTEVTIQHGYVFAHLADGTRWVKAGTDRTFGIRKPHGARYRCDCCNYYNLPRDIARHLTSGNCTAL